MTTNFTKCSEIALVVLFYWVTSISMTFGNKYMVGNKFGNISEDITIFLAWAQCTITILTIMVVYLTQCFVCRKKDVTLPELKTSFFYNINIIILMLSFSMMLFLNNLTLKYVGISFFQVARSLALVFTVILTRLFLNQNQSKLTVICCMVIILGFIMGIDQEKLAGNLSVIGMVCGVISSALVALTGIFMKRSLEVIDNSYVLVFYMNIGSTVIFLPLLMLFNQFQIIYYFKLQDKWFLVHVVATGVLGFLVNLASNMEINCTSPTTHQISNNAKSVLQTILAVVIFSESKSLFWWFSNFLVVFGAVAYTIFKFRESK